MKHQLIIAATMLALTSCGRVSTTEVRLTSEAGDTVIAGLSHACLNESANSQA